MHVRQAVDGDEGTVRLVRLRARADAPEAFGSTLEREQDRTPASWRRGGAADLVEAVLAWSREVGAETVRLHVVDGNVSACRIYERYGFRPTGQVEVCDRDGPGRVGVAAAAGRELTC